MNTPKATTRLKPLCREVDVTENPRHLDGVDSLSYAMLLASYRDGQKATENERIRSMHNQTREAERELLDTLDELGWNVTDLRVQEDTNQVQYADEDEPRVLSAVDVEIEASQILGDRE